MATSISVPGFVVEAAHEMETTLVEILTQFKVAEGIVWEVVPPGTVGGNATVILSPTYQLRWFGVN